MKNEVNKEYTRYLETVYEFKEPCLYQIVVHNDDFTPMEFVVNVLEQFFYLDRRMAANIMLEAHVNGKATIGWYSKDFAESKTSQVNDYARVHEHPLSCTMEDGVPGG
ncbi:MAG: ATP-dependent Clp protease adapter ClpS [Gammaproteobacteria bacterium]|nr:MAG: ATP-dependent Clp protease adapter ClpS [Gammaproteobacteria bacterium]